MKRWSSQRGDILKSISNTNFSTEVMTKNKNKRLGKLIHASNESSLYGVLTK